MDLGKARVHKHHGDCFHLGETGRISLEAMSCDPAMYQRNNRETGGGREEACVKQMGYVEYFSYM